LPACLLAFAVTAWRFGVWFNENTTTNKSVITLTSLINMKRKSLFKLAAAVVMLSASVAFGQVTYQSTILADQPTGYWPLQETNGPIIYDIVGTNNGTMMVGVTMQSPGSYSSFATNDGSLFGLGGPGILFGEPSDTAIYFTNANNAAIFVPYAPELNGTHFTAEAWMHFAVYPITPPAPTVDMSPLDFTSNGGSQRGWAFYMDDGQSGLPAGWMQGWGGKGSGWLQTPTPTSPSFRFSGQWVYAVLTYDGSTLIQYMNGVEVSRITGTISKVSSPTPLVMGCFQNSAPNIYGRFYEGGMSHVAVYTNALSSGQVLSHYYVGKFGSALPPSIGTQPVGGTNYVGYGRILLVAAAGNAPLHYQWSKDASPIVGATNMSLVFTNLQLTNAGSYTVAITNALGSTNSDAAVVGVLALPSNPYQAAVISQFPQAYYPLNETSGTIAADIINTGDNQATYIGFPTLGDPGASSYLGTAVTLDGTTQGVKVNNPATMNIVGHTTMEAWVLIQDTNFDQVIIDHGPAVPQNPSKQSNILGLEVDPNTGAAFYYIQSFLQTNSLPNVSQGITNGATYPIPAADVGNWVYLVGVADGTAWRLYRNGVEVTNSPDTTGAVSANGGWAFGALNASWATFLWGSINNVGIYDYALTPGTVQQHYQLGLTGVYTPPPTMSIQRSGANVTVSWTSGFLQEAISITGPWTYADTNTVISPYTVGASNAASFFRATLLPPP
jgi:Concanavalin A-like lectin/glucanases superfamily